MNFHKKLKIKLKFKFKYFFFKKKIDGCRKIPLIYNQESDFPIISISL